MEIQPQNLNSTRVLPDSYQKIWGLDLAQDRTSALVLNLVSLPLFVVCGWLLMMIAEILKPGIASIASLNTIPVHPLAAYLSFLAVIVGFTVVHEAVHGLFFWIFTRSKPVFGIRLLFAYAGAPEWYIPRDQYAVVGLAPLVLITIVGMLAIPWAPVHVAQLLLLGVVVNVGGAVGDLYVCGKVLAQSRRVLVNDTGFVFALFDKSDLVHSTVAQR